MITFSAIKDAACAVKGDKLSFIVFPAKDVKDQWVIKSHPEEDMKPKVVCWPGEYDFGGMIMRGVGQQDGRQVSYTCEYEGVRFAFVDTPVMDWTDSDIEGLGDIGILVVAADDPKKISALVEAVDPRVVILFSVEDGNTAAVAKALGSAAESVSEYKVKSGNLPNETRQVVILG